MKRSLPFFFLMLLSSLGMAQDCGSERYLSNLFQSAVSQNVVFGTSPALTTVYVAENVTVDQDMTMDIFFPVDDLLPKRPLVILAYGGGYLFGTKEDEDVWATCDSLAKKGYVTASINYRMNLNVASSASSVRAIYRAAQDYSSAIRYLKEYADTYRIDTNYVFVGGVSAGGFSAMHAVFLDENERPAATFQSGLFNENPDLGCLSCAGNGFQHSNRVRGIINLWGALMDTAFIQSDELVPMTLFHGTNDLIVPYDHGFPFTALFLMPEVHGSANIAARVNNLGGMAELNTFAGVGHNIWGLNVNNQLVGGPTEHWMPITDSIISFLYENIRPDQPMVQFSTPLCQSDTVFLHVTNFPSDGRACWQVELGDVIWASADSSQIGVIWNAVGTFGVSVTVFNHLDAASVITELEVSIAPMPGVSISANGGQLEATGGFAHYQWYLDGHPIPGEEQSAANVSTNGLYTVEVTTSDGCTTTSDGFVFVGIHDSEPFGPNIGMIRVSDPLGKLLGTFATQQSLSAWCRTQSGVLFIEYFNTDLEPVGAVKMGLMGR